MNCKTTQGNKKAKENFIPLQFVQLGSDFGIPSIAAYSNRNLWRFA